MKFIFTLSLAILLFHGLHAQNVGIGTATPSRKLDVAGSMRADTLSGTNHRVMRASGTGDVDAIPQGNVGDVLTQAPGGPQWAGLTLSPSGSGMNCDTCVTMLSPLAAGTMTCGACMRYCDGLTSGGFSDWRMPSQEELVRLFAQSPNLNVNVWTTTRRETNMTWITVNLQSAFLSDNSGLGGNNCICVR